MSDGRRWISGEDGTYREIRSTFLTGVSVVVPVLITVYVLSIAFDFLLSALSPVVGILEGLGVGGEEGLLIARGIAVGLLVGAVFAVGSATRFRFGERAVGYFDEMVEAIPGVGAVYASFRQMGDVLVEGESDSFQEVYLVEFPYDDCYVVGFQTAEAPEAVEGATGDDMITLFLPLAPNPMMGGFLAHIPEGRAFEVDMSVEEGVRAVATLGIATGSEDAVGVDGEIDVRGVLEYDGSILGRGGDEG